MAVFQASAATKLNADVTRLTIVAMMTVVAAWASARAMACARSTFSSEAWSIARRGSKLRGSTPGGKPNRRRCSASCRCWSSLIPCPPLTYTMVSGLLVCRGAPLVYPMQSACQADERPRDGLFHVAPEDRDASPIVQSQQQRAVVVHILG